jgi:hypothetical protein
MQLDENDHQLLGFIELNVSDLYDAAGKQHGRSAEWR